MASALEGVRILDFSRLLPGPYCTMLLGDLGADVVKVEESKQGDYLRWRAPYVNGEGAPFMSLNRNKRSLTLNLKHPKGQELLRRLVATSDVLFEQFRPGVMKRLNSDYDTLKKINPRLIYVALSGYGQDGPYVNMTGHDINYLSIAGITGLNGPADGAPVPTGIQIADLSSGQFVAMAILAALHHVDRTGEGQYIDISMTDGVVSWQSLAAAYLFAGGEPQVRGKTRYTGGLPCYHIYECKGGGYISIGANEPQFWEHLCQVMARPDFIPYQFTEEKRGEVFAAFNAMFLTKTRDEWFELMKDKDICVGPVNDLDETFRDPQVLHREMVLEYDHPKAGRVKTVGFPMKFHGTPAKIHRHSPGFGEHTEEILTELGYSKAEIEELRKEQAI